MNPLARALAPAALLASLTLAPGRSHAQTDPRYFGQIRAELQAMGLAAQCASASTQAGSCRVRASASQAGTQPAGTPANGRQFMLTLEYSDVSDTVYVYIDHYATLHSDGSNAPAATRRLLEMNWEMLLGKFEWSPATGEVRLGAVLNTDSNFDRRAFRSVVRSVLRLADRWADEVTRLTGSPVGEVIPPGGSGSAPAAPAAATVTPAPAPGR